ncbi:hypothetical protein LCGC14_0346500 [marine sediment metagenome]|uniref:Uncharacterized protein n=1 Tax=marine sediment metagenome TaxID=412755 RepID=A0A0F9WK79_9ZZZZ
MNYHILKQQEKRKTINVAFHIPIPAGTNKASIEWKDALVLELGGSANIASVLPNISVPEDTALKAGTLFEAVRTVQFSSVQLDDAQRKATIETRYGDLLTEIVDEKKITLEWIGFEADVP